jgi:hypothetical protein
MKKKPSRQVSVPENSTADETDARYLRVSHLIQPLVKNRLVTRLDLAKCDSHSFAVSHISYPAVSQNLRSAVTNYEPDRCPRRERRRCLGEATKQTQIAGTCHNSLLR